jgi:hypothetical protein
VGLDGGTDQVVDGGKVRGRHLEVLASRDGEDGNSNACEVGPQQAEEDADGGGQRGSGLSGLPAQQVFAGCGGAAQQDETGGALSSRGETSCMQGAL